MLIPSSHQTALLLLIVGLACLGSWANTFKVAKWRFELFYIDFVLGALGLSLLAAFTLGTLGSELSFNDRIAVAGLRSQAFALSAGFLFSVGNLLLLAAISLVGIAIAFPLALSLAFLLSAYFQGTGSLALFGAGAALLLLACVFAAAAARVRSTPKPGATPQAAKARRARAVKGIVVGLIGGVLIGISAPLAASSFWGDLGLGAYGGLLMFSLGLTASGIVFALVFMNIAIEGGRVTLGTYRSGGLKQHLLGIAGGTVWACGMLAVLLAQSPPAAEMPSESLLTIAVQLATLLNVLWGVLAWKELSAAPGRVKIWLSISFLSFAGAIAALALRQRA